MKICFIGNLRSTHFRTLCNFFKKKHDVHAITWEGDLKGVTVHRILRNLYGFPINLFLVKSIIKKIKPDVVHAQYLPNAGVYGAFSGFSPFFADPMGGEIATNCWWKLLLNRYVFKKVDALFTHEKIAAKRLRDLGYKGKLIVKARGIDLKKFKKRNVRKKDLIVICRHIEPKYNTHVFFKAIKHVVKKYPDMKFLCISQWIDKKYKKKIEKIIKNNGIENNVKIVGFIKDFDKFRDTIASARIVIDTFSTELPGLGLGYGDIESISLGTPVIASKRPVLMLKDPKWFYGLMYNNKNEKDLAKKIIYLLDNKKLQKDMVRKGQKTIKKHFNMEKNISEMEKIFKSYVD